MDIRAKVRFLQIAPRKLRLVADQVRGRDADQASIMLQFMPQKGAKHISKLLDSAIANAEENFELNRQDLYIAEIQVNEGPAQRRVKAGARGRFKPRLKRYSHIDLVLREYDYEGINIDGA